MFLLNAKLNILIKKKKKKKKDRINLNIFIFQIILLIINCPSDLSEKFFFLNPDT